MQASVEEDLPQATMSVFKDRPFFFLFLNQFPFQLHLSCRNNQMRRLLIIVKI